MEPQGAVDMRGWWKSLTIKFGVFGSLIGGFLATNAGMFENFLIGLGLSQSTAELVFKILIWLTAAKTAGGVAYGRLRKAPPLEVR